MDKNSVVVALQKGDQYKKQFNDELNAMTDQFMHLLSACTKEEYMDLGVAAINYNASIKHEVKAQAGEIVDAAEAIEMHVKLMGSSLMLTAMCNHKTLMLEHLLEKLQELGDDSDGD